MRLGLHHSVKRTRNCDSTWAMPFPFDWQSHQQLNRHRRSSAVTFDAPYARIDAADKAAIQISC